MKLNFFEPVLSIFINEPSLRTEIILKFLNPSNFSFELGILKNIFDTNRDLFKFYGYYFTLQLWSETKNKQLTIRDTILVLKITDFKSPREIIEVIEKEYSSEFTDLEYISFFDNEIAEIKISEIVRRIIPQLPNLQNYTDY